VAKDRYFPVANVTFTDTHLLTSDSRYGWSELLYAEVVTKRYPIDWRLFIQVYSFLFFCAATIWAIASTFGWVNIAGPMLAILWLIITLYDARDEVKKSYKHTLTLETSSGTVEVTTSDNDNALLEVCEAINRRIKRNASAPKPVHAGEPTRWIQAN
jgi:hypothetical protein